ncbi:hypothetical protein BCR32DRAFT_270509, partial [Anaeromyces robustus]
MILSFSILIIVFQNFNQALTQYFFIIIGLCMIYLTSKFFQTQPYYNKYINMIRGGTWTMIIGLCFVNLLSYIFGSDKSFFSIILLVVGICSFIIGIIFCRKFYNSHIQGIYSRFKEKKIYDKKQYNHEHNIESSNGSENEEKSQLLFENEEMSTNSDNELENKGKSKGKKDNRDSEEDDNDSDDDNEYDSDENSLLLNDRVSQKISAFGSIQEIFNTVVINESIVVFKDYNDFELACRFIWNNETKEAFYLIKELYDECTKNFKKN